MTPRSWVTAFESERKELSIFIFKCPRDLKMSYAQTKQNKRVSDKFIGLEGKNQIRENRRLKGVPGLLTVDGGVQQASNFARVITRV